MTSVRAGGGPPLTVERVAEMLAGTFPGGLGVEPLEVADDLSRGRLVVEPRHLHPGGFVHGGVFVTLADTVAAWGTIRNLPPGHVHSTIEMKVNLFGLGRLGDVLEATGRPKHVGKRTQVWEVEVANGDRPGALFVCTQMALSAGD